LSKKQHVDGTAAAGTVRWGSFGAVAAVIVAKFSEHVEHLSKDEKLAATVAVGAAINFVVTKLENRSGWAWLRPNPPKPVKDGEHGRRIVDRVRSHKSTPAPPSVRLADETLEKLAASIAEALNPPPRPATKRTPRTVTPRTSEPTKGT
jgi:hypothetical protein